MEFADNYLMIGLIACIVVLIVFLIWYHTRKAIPVDRLGVPLMENPPPAPPKPRFGAKAFCFDGINYILETDFVHISMIRAKDLAKADETIKDLEKKLASLTTASPRKPVKMAPDQFRYFRIVSIPNGWTVEKRLKYEKILEKYSKIHPALALNHDYFCMDCGFNAKGIEFKINIECPHCQSFRIKAVPYL